jgi:hypothetical protein
MQRNSIYIIGMSFCFGCISLLYFWGLIVGLPLVANILLVALVCIGVFVFLLKKTPDTLYALTFKQNLLLTMGVILMSTFCLFLARKNGDWDAVYIYNLAAKFLEDPVHWRQLFLYKDQLSHTDYPLHVPALVAFLQRITGGGFKESVPYFVSLFYTLAVATIIFLETAHVHKLLSAIVFILIGTNTYFLNNGVIQCADIPLSFYLLLSFVFMQHYRQTPKEKIWILYCGIALGCAIWIKNEGTLYAFLFCIVFYKELFAKKNMLVLSLGVMPFVLTLLIFKIAYAPTNDLIKGLGQESWTVKLLDKQRYKLIVEAFVQYIGLYFYIPQLAAIAYVFLSIYKQKTPDKSVLIFILFALGITIVYVFTYQNLSWHLQTSMSRILLQWYPSFWFVLVIQLGKLMPSPGVQEEIDIRGINKKP